MVDITDLLAYNDAEGRAFFKVFAKLSWDGFTKNREAEFPENAMIYVVGWGLKK